MNHGELHPASIKLRKGGILRLSKAQGQRIESLSGNLWVTMDHDLRDILVKPGQGFSIDTEGSGDTLISALDDARFVVLEPADASGY